MPALTMSDLELACIPASALGSLAMLRCEPSIEAAIVDSACWVRWELGKDEITGIIHSVRGAQLYGRGSAGWQRWGSVLPTREVPEHVTFRPLSAVIFPERIPRPSPAMVPRQATIRLVASGEPRATTAMETPLATLEAWAATVPPARLETLQIARSGSTALVLGKNLPWLEPNQRYWGRKILMPLGRTCQPALAESDLRAAFGVADDQLLILRDDGWEAVAEEHFGPMHLASLRHAIREGT
jgi:hypothetical protein